MAHFSCLTNLNLTRTEKKEGGKEWNFFVHLMCVAQATIKLQLNKITTMGKRFARHLTMNAYTTICGVVIDIDSIQFDFSFIHTVKLLRPSILLFISRMGKSQRSSNTCTFAFKLLYSTIRIHIHTNGFVCVSVCARE